MPCSVDSAARRVGVRSWPFVSIRDRTIGRTVVEDINRRAALEVAIMALGKLNVEPGDLSRVAGEYSGLQTAAAAIGPHAVDEVNRIIATHGPMGYPVAVDVVAGLARRQATLETKAADFGQYSERFVEHADAYRDADHQGAQRAATAAVGWSTSSAHWGVGAAPQAGADRCGPDRPLPGAKRHRRSPSSPTGWVALTLPWGRSAATSAHASLRDAVMNATGAR
jgi:hypothetical protein